MWPPDGSPYGGAESGTLRAEVIARLMELYGDPFTRPQFQRFDFPPAMQPALHVLLRELNAHLLVELRGPNIARLTPLGFQMLDHERAKAAAAAAGPPGPPPIEVLRQLQADIGHLDYLTQSRLENGTFHTIWADAGLERVIGYSVQDLERLGGWPVALRDTDPAVLSDLFARLLTGERVAGELDLTSRSGNLVRVRFAAHPRFDALGSRVIGAWSGGRVVS